MTELEAISARIRKELKRFEEDTVAGNAKDYGDYRYACGIYRGLMMANSFIIELAEYNEDSDD